MLWVLWSVMLLVYLASAQHPWPMFRGGASHSGRSSNLIGSKPSETWRVFLSETEGCSSPALAADGSIYVTSYSYEQGFRAFNCDGSQRWVFKKGWGGSSPAVDPEGRIYVTGGEYLYAVNPDGSEKWRCKIGHTLISSPVIGPKNMIYVGTEDSCLYCIGPNGNVAWRFRTGAIIKCSPAVDSNGTTYFGSYDKHLYALNADGLLKWRYQTGGEVLSSPAIGDDAVYFGSCDSCVYALDFSGKLRWRYKAGGKFYSSPAVGIGGTVYIGCCDSYVYAIRASGTLKWRCKVGNSEVVASPVLDGRENVYVGLGRERRAVALDSVGRVIWTAKIPGSLQSSPAVGENRMIYLLTHYPSYLVALQGN